MGSDSVIPEFLDAVRYGVEEKFISSNLIGVWSGGKGYNIDVID